MSAAPNDNRPLIDPDQFEAAGRRLRRLLDRMRRLRLVGDSAETAIDWEDGEPRDEGTDGLPGRR